MIVMAKYQSRRNASNSEWDPHGSSGDRGRGFDYAQVLPRRRYSQHGIKDAVDRIT